MEEKQVKTIYNKVISHEIKPVSSQSADGIGKRENHDQNVALNLQSNFIFVQ